MSENVILYRSNGGGGGSFGNSPGTCTNLSAIPKSNEAWITWTDPDDIRISGGSTVRWGYTMIVRKAGSIPISETDGVVVVRSSIRNQYEENPFIDTGLTNHTKYYYAAFSFSDEGVVNPEIVTVDVTPIPWKIMTVRININDSNPSTRGSYRDDAIGMGSGMSVPEWDAFFNYKPCVFKDGKVVGYLNPNDFTKFEDGSNSYIDDETVGDVMVEFPRRGVRFQTDNREYLDISMTNNPNDPDFTYYAHTRGSESRDYFYLASYPAYIVADKLRSVRGKYPSMGYTMDNYRTKAHNNGSGYELYTWYQCIYIQCMYCLQFHGNTNSQSALGNGNSGGYDIPASGKADKCGMIFGGYDKNYTVKLFGIENIYAYMWQWVDGILGCCSNNHVYVTTDNFNDTADGYKDLGVCNEEGGYLEVVIGTADLGFIIQIGSGSDTTYYCDYAVLNLTRSFTDKSQYHTMLVGNGKSCNVGGGLFSMDLLECPDDIDAYDRGTRLSYY